MRTGMQSLSTTEFLKAVYPDEYKLMGKLGETAGHDDERVAAARAGEYYAERKPHPRIELETLSGVVRLEKRLDRIEMMLRYVIERMPEPEATPIIPPTSERMPITPPAGG